MVLKTKIDPNQTDLTEEQLAAIEQEANEEYDGVGDEQEDSQEEEKGKNQGEDDAEKKEIEDESEEKPEHEPEEKESKEEGGSEDKTEDKSGDKPEEKQEDKKKSEPTADEVKAYALKHEISEADAKKEIQKNRDTLAFYKDPESLARSHRKLQSEFDSLKAKVDKGDKPEAPKLTGDPNQAIRTHVDKNREQIVEKFRQKYPAKSELMTDEAIVEEVIDRAEQNYNVWREKRSIEITKEAADKRDVLISGLNETDKEFIADIKAALKETHDSIILDPEFTLSDIVRWAKGGKFDDRVKTAYDEGYRKGKEEAQILGERVPPKPKGTGAKTGSAEVVNLNDDQKERALEMFDIPGLPDEEKFKMYKDTFKKDLQKNPRFVG